MQAPVCKLIAFANLDIMVRWPLASFLATVLAQFARPTITALGVIILVFVQMVQNLIQDLMDVFHAMLVNSALMGQLALLVLSIHFPNLDLILETSIAYVIQDTMVV